MLKKYVPYSIKKILKKSYYRLRVANKQKIFCIGLNKTGTTSVKYALEELNYVVGNETEAKKLLTPWLKRNFNPIIQYCKTAQAFQDSPFSFPYTYIILDYAFPGSKFILTVRDDAEEWYNSITRFHAKLWGNGKIPTKSNLLNAKKGRPWIVNQELFKTPGDDPYNKSILMNFYNQYITEVKDYFKNRPNDLLVINLKEEKSYKNFCEFLGCNPIKERFPWKNKT